MKKVLLFLAIVLSFGQISAQAGSPWQEVSSDRADGLQKVKEKPYSANQRLLTVDMQAFKQILANAAESGTGAGLQISLPTISGTEEFVVWETSNFAPELRAQYPDIKSYVGKGISDPTAYLRFSVAPIGVQTMVLRANSGAEFIEAYTTDHSVYVVFDRESRTAGRLPFNCGTTDDAAINEEALHRTGATLLANNQTLKTFRLALSCTSEYTTYFGGTIPLALAGMNATMTRVNGVLDIDMAVKLEIIAGTTAVIYTNAGSDPYSSAAVGSAEANANSPVGWNIQLQNTLTSVLGNAAYDIGHLFGASGGGGNAGCIGCICVDDSASTTDKNKGSGFTSPSDDVPAGDSFDIDFVIHEMGHQMGANHTFSYGVEGAGVNVEPGSGVTIMAYAGVAPVAEWNIQAHSIPIFAYRSILQMQTNLLTKTCSVNTTLTNHPPVVNAGADYTIPNGTAFILKGTGTDEDGDTLNYVWEQNDNANNTVTGANSLVSPTKLVGPTFRTFLPTASPNRFMPKYSTVLAGSLSNTWETVSDVGRTLTFNFTARDNHPNGGQTGKDASAIIVSNTAGPFEVTSQGTAGVNWVQFTNQTIAWNTNGAEALPGSANVNIKLSVDGGITFPITLAANTPNDGSEIITVPDIPDASACRIWIEPTANTYYAINAKPFSIGYSCNRESVAANMDIPDGNGSNVTGAIATSTLSVTQVATITAGMKVNFQAEHSWIGDMVIKIKHPDNTTRILWNRYCNTAAFSAVNVNFMDGAAAINAGACANINNGGSYAPNQTLGAFTGKATNGTWSLTAQDYFTGDTGIVLSWGVDFGCVLGSPQFDESAFAIYPNPSNGNFTVEYTSPVASDVNISVHDIRGRKVFENKYTNTGMFIQNIALSNAEAGIYLVTVQEGNKKMVKKIMIQ